MTEMHCTDPLELDVAQMLREKHIPFVHESQNKDQRLDFYLPDYDVYIECKQFHSDRVLEQLRSQRNVILLQGHGSVYFLKMIL